MNVAHVNVRRRISAYASVALVQLTSASVSYDDDLFHLGVRLGVCKDVDESIKRVKRRKLSSARVVCRVAGLPGVRVVPRKLVVRVLTRVELRREELRRNDDCLIVYSLEVCLDGRLQNVVHRRPVLVAVANLAVNHDEGTRCLCVVWVLAPIRLNARPIRADGHAVQL